MPMSDGQQVFDRVFPVPGDALYGALMSAVAGPPFKKVRGDAFTRSAEFRSSRSAFSWGHHWQAQVVDDPAGSRLHLTAAVTIAAGAQHGGSGKRASEVASKLFADVSAALQSEDA